MSVLGYLDRQSKAVLTALGAVLVGLAGLLQYLTAPDLSFLIYYLVPVSLVAWCVGRRAGIGIALASAAVSGLAWLAAGPGAGPAAPASGVPTSTVTAQCSFFLVILAYVLTPLKGAFERAARLARTDYLTGVANARYFAELAEAEFQRARRYQRPFTLSYLDIDNFKAVNDRFGHSTGDTLLRTVAETIRSRTRTSDLIARLGGDEFAILLPETGYEAAQAVVQKVRDSLLEVARQRTWPVSFSIGVVTCLEPPDSVDALIKVADRLMYSVKYSGKNGIRHDVLGKSPATPREDLLA